MATTGERRARLSIDVPREERRRIHIAAARCDVSIRGYVWQAVEARPILPDCCGNSPIGRRFSPDAASGNPSVAQKD